MILDGIWKRSHKTIAFPWCIKDESLLLFFLNCWAGLRQDVWQHYALKQMCRCTCWLINKMVELLREGHDSWMFLFFHSLISNLAIDIVVLHLCKQYPTVQLVTDKANKLKRNVHRCVIKLDLRKVVEINACNQNMCFNHLNCQL